jgi:uncharacterized protein
MSKGSSKLPQIQSVPWNWVQALLVGVLVVVGVDIVLGLSLGILAPLLRLANPELGAKLLDSADTSLGLNFSLYAISRLAGLAVLVAFVSRRGGGWRTLGIKKAKILRSIGYVLVASLALLVLVALAFYLTELLAPQVDLDQAQEIDLAKPTNLFETGLSFVALVLIAPFVEEIIFRGFMFPAFAKRFGVAVGVIVTSGLFGLVHMQANVGIVTAIMGVLLCWLYLRTHSLWPAILFHSLKNLIAFSFIIASL